MIKQFVCATALACVLAVGMTGCSPKQLSPEEAAAERERQLKMVERVYPDKSPEEVIKAADRVFRLADDDYVLSHSPNGFTANRRYVIYLIITAGFGDDSWSVTAQPQGSGTKVTALHSAVGGSMTPLVSGGGAVAPMQSQTANLITTQPAPYQLFFSRLEHLLYNKGEWLTCKKAKKIFTEGSLDPFCICANDRTPDGMSATQRELRDNPDKDKNEMGGIRSPR